MYLEGTIPESAKCAVRSGMYAPVRRPTNRNGFELSMHEYSSEIIRAS
jgi:hypothetical protein